MKTRSSAYFLNFVIKIFAILFIISPSIAGVFDKPGYFIFQFILSLLVLKKEQSAFQLRLIVFFSFLSILITFSDLFLRFYFKDNFEYRPQDKYSELDNKLKNNWKYKANIISNSVTYGDLAAMTGDKKYREYRNVLFMTDSFGFRNDPSKKNTPRKIIFCGDSFIDGVGVSQENNISGVFERKYNMQSYNLAVSGYSPWHKYINLIDIYDKIKTTADCQIMLFIFLGNDLEDDYYSETELAQLKQDKSVLLMKINSWRRKSILRRSWRSFFKKERESKRVIVKQFINGRPILFYADYYERMLKDINYFKNHRNSNNLKNILELFRKFADNKKNKLSVFLIPTKCEVYSWVLTNVNENWKFISPPTASAIYLSEICREKKIDFFDLTPVMLNESKIKYSQQKKILWHYDDTHLNEVGIELISDYIYNNVLK